MALTGTSSDTGRYNFAIESVSEPTKSRLPSVVRKLTGRHDGLYVRLQISQRIKGPDNVTSRRLTEIRVRVTSSGKDRNTQKMQKLFREAVRVESPVNGSNASPIFLDPKSLKKHLLETDLIPEDQKEILGDVLLNHKESLSDALNSLASEGASPYNGKLEDLLAGQSDLNVGVDPYMSLFQRNQGCAPVAEYSNLPNEGYSSSTKPTPTRANLPEFLEALGAHSEEAVLGEGGNGVVKKGRFEGKDVAIKTLKRGKGELINQDSLRGEGLGLCLSDKKTRGTFIKFHLLVVDIYENKQKNAKIKERRAVRTQGEFFRLPPNSHIVATVSDRGGARIPLEKIELNQAINIGRQAAEGLAAVHAQGIVHHDFKPGNCLVDIDGKVRLIDPGLSKYLGKNGKTKSSAGTSWYLAPEAMKQKPHDHKVDSWALGITLFNLLIGEDQGYENRLSSVKGIIGELNSMEERLQDKIKNKNKMLKSYKFSASPEAKIQFKNNLKRVNREINNIKLQLIDKKTQLEDALRQHVAMIAQALSRGLPPNLAYRSELTKIVLGLLKLDPKLRMSAKEAARRLAVIEKKIQKEQLHSVIRVSENGNPSFTDSKSGGGKASPDLRNVIVVGSSSRQSLSIEV